MEKTGDVVDRPAQGLQDEVVRPDQLVSLRGRVAVVVGGSRGIGRAIALSFAAAGAEVFVVGRDARALQDVARVSEGLGARTRVLAQDVATLQGVRRTIEVAQQEFGRIDVLANVAGINIRKPALDVTEADWDAVLGLNLRSVFFMSQAAARIMIEQGGGKIINVASLVSTIGIRNLSVYGASKGGVVQLTKALAVEWAPNGIAVNAIGPGYIETDLTAPVFQDPVRREWIHSRIPMGRHGFPRDLAGAALFLASEASNYITGQVIYVDGGWLSG